MAVSSGWASGPLPAPVPPAGGACDIGTRPAATLLVPYFEVDSSRDDGPDTLVGIVNLDDDPTVAHVVVWNVDAWAVAAFNIYLAGSDVTTFSMRQILAHGRMPNNGCTSSVYRFTTQYIDCDGDGMYFGEPWTRDDGLFSSNGSPWDAACYSDIAPDVLIGWQCKLSIGSYDGWNANYVGYLTIDATLTCSGGLPDQNGQKYFAVDYLDTDGDRTPDHGVLENSNILMGDILYYNASNAQSDGVPAVHIQALGEENSARGHTWGLTPAKLEEWGISTFWNKYEYFEAGSLRSGSPVRSGMPPNDARESLPLWWEFRYITNSAFDGGTWVDVWRSHNPTFEHWYVPDGPCAWDGKGTLYTTLYDWVEQVPHVGLPYPGLVVHDEEEHKVSGFL